MKKGIRYRRRGGLYYKNSYRIYLVPTNMVSDWTKETFALNNINDIRNLRDHLRAYNIYILRDGRRIAENLAIIVSINEYHKWTEAKANEELKLNKIFHFY
jgi:hypothetical protein